MHVGACPGVDTLSVTTAASGARLSSRCGFNETAVPPTVTMAKEVRHSTDRCRMAWKLIVLTVPVKSRWNDVGPLPVSPSAA